MILTTRASFLLAALAYTSTCLADVWSTDPTATTHWKIGSSAEIHWRLSAPTSKQDVVTIFLVGGDPAAYKRLGTLGKDVVLGDHKLTVSKVPNVSCGSSCALEFWIADGPGRGDYYTHTFTISTEGVAAANGTAAAIAIVPTGSTSQDAATPSGPITLVQNTAKGAQLQAAGASTIFSQGALALALTAATNAVALSSLF
ncbi:hypothetical protein BC939DRAFT_528581 [Gamsiella multidivaricata]|uniref:uncharacterized protein n=1 Tax=Gamsiella multidivaricata TaxID=101098 RepID=UPI002220FB37|nr:uncharacterized protein BC939DRAFT_528581 [Gamsiella multidivaricata]KAI7824385.1 hypothetical protein BC939DRAFT_528581 [Gamsiella multidivaricata]